MQTLCHALHSGRYLPLVSSKADAESSLDGYDFYWKILASLHHLVKLVRQGKLLLTRSQTRCFYPIWEWLRFAQLRKLERCRCLQDCLVWPLPSWQFLWFHGICDNDSFDLLFWWYGYFRLSSNLPVLRWMTSFSWFYEVSVDVCFPFWKISYTHFRCVELHPAELVNQTQSGTQNLWFVFAWLDAFCKRIIFKCLWNRR